MLSGSRPSTFVYVTLLPLVGVASLSAMLLCTPLVGCSGKVHSDFPASDGVTENTDGGDDGSTGVTLPGNDDAGLNLGDSSASGSNDNSMCKGGFYEGSFGGLYSSHLTLIGVNIPVVGDVQMTLKQQGTGQQTCTFQGESEQCSNIFSVKDGVIKGLADGLFPYYCTLSGTLGCKEKKLVDGWINCTYCVGPLNDGGMSCAIWRERQRRGGRRPDRHRRTVRRAPDCRLLLHQHRR